MKEKDIKKKHEVTDIIKEYELKISKCSLNNRRNLSETGKYDIINYTEKESKKNEEEEKM